MMKKILLAVYLLAGALSVSAQSYQDLVKQGLDAISRDSLLHSFLFYLLFFRILVCSGAMTSLSVP